MRNQGEGSKEYRLVPVETEEEAEITETRVRRGSELVASLVKDATAGDEGAFDRLVFLYGNIAESALKRYGEKAQFPEDIYQEAITAVVDSIRNYIGRDNFLEKTPSEISTLLNSAVHNEVKRSIEKYSESLVKVPESEKFEAEAKAGDERREIFRELFTEKFELEKELKELDQEKEVAYPSELKLKLSKLSLKMLHKELQQFKETELREVTEREKEINDLIRELWKVNDILSGKTEIPQTRFFERRKEFNSTRNRRDEIIKQLNEKRVSRKDYRNVLDQFCDKIKLPTFPSDYLFTFEKILTEIEEYLALVEKIDGIEKRIGQLEEDIVVNRRKGAGYRLRDREMFESESHKNMREYPLRISDPEVLSRLLAEDAEDQVLRNLLIQELNDVLGTLKEDQARAIELRFGLNGKDSHTSKEAAEVMGVTPNRVRHLESQALSRLRSSSMSERLRVYLNKE